MKHLSVQERIRRVATRFTACQYIFANWTQLNVALDSVDKTTICYILPPSGTITTKRAATQFVDKPLTQIAFLAPSELDFDGEKNDCVIERLKLLICMFVKAINESGYFEMIDDEEISYQVFYDTADDNVTGLLLTLPISEDPRTICKISEDFGYQPLSDEELKDVSR